MDKGIIASAMLSNTLANILDHEDRTQFIGGSDVAAILGMDPYKTRLQVYEEKVGITQPFEGNQHTRRGNRQEPVAAAVFTERFGDELARVNRRLVHGLYPFLTARIDRRIVGKRRVAEIKVPSLGAFARIKRVGLHEGYIAQMQHYIALTRYEGGEWIIFCPDQDEMVTFPMERDNVFIERATEQLVEFWHEHIIKRIPPPASEQDTTRLEIRSEEAAYTTYNVREEQEFAVAMDMLREVRQLSGEAEQLGEEARTQLKTLIGDRLGVFVGDDFRLSYTMAKGRASFDAKALAGAKPLDRIAVEGAIQKLVERHGWGSAETVYARSLFQDTSLDLSPFVKQGVPYPILRPTFYGEE